MEDQSKSSLTITLWWVLTGVLIVSAAFIVGSKWGLWTAIDASGIVAGLYLIALTLYVVRKPLGWRTRLLAYLVVGFGLGAVAFLWYRSQATAGQQATLRRQQYAEQTRGNMVSIMTERLRQSMQEYYRHEPKAQGSLREIFVRQNPVLKEGKKEDFDFIGKWSLKMQPQAMDSVVLVAQSDYKGRNPDFKNQDGTVGRVQEKTILTRKGIVRVSEN
ncbi:MAG: hypothetical protein NTZ35_09110 [Ignavibacteriales bacterium]|nr:hypothetical protein [Ignavibacteriales bacterium]